MIHRFFSAVVVTALVSNGLLSSAWATEGLGVERALNSTPAMAPVAVDPAQPFSKTLATYNLFLDPQRQVPNHGVVPYDLNTPHFADYARLHRFVWLPAGASCRYLPDGSLDYPVGAAIISTVGYAHDLRQPELGERLVETRLWILRDGGWEGAQYVWNDDATQAQLSVAGDPVNVTWIDHAATEQHHRFRIPNRNQCVQCHEINSKIIPLGPLHARNLNKPFAYDSGKRNQLQYWSDIGYLVGLPEGSDTIPRLPIWDDPQSGDLDSRARAYLDMNCSSCHRPGGVAYTSGLDLRYEQTEPVRFGIFKAPVAAGRATGNGRFVIEPGEPDKSILLKRLESTDPGIRMPVVGRDLKHDEGVQLIRSWIEGMRYPDLAAGQHEIDRRVSSYRQQLAAKLELTRGEHSPVPQQAE
ncbi:MAG: hypothetical protein KF752_06265 [Pirellulaceae bacterium]|nr:hypothetical protein [Pirellulaceae bacterium]